MIHVDALPGTARYAGNISAIVDKAIAEARIYRAAGLDALAIENMHDVPYLKKVVGPEITAVMSVIGSEVKRATELPIGIQILAGANQEALAAAHAAGLDFIRAEGFVFAQVADEGLMEADAGELLRYRKRIGADRIAIFTDIKKKHSSHAITADMTVAETAKAAEFFLSDGVIVTGKSTAMAVDLQELRSVQSTVAIPVLVGSGVTLENVADYFAYCDGMIIGSWFKKEGIWSNNVDPDRVAAFMARVSKLRSN